MYNVFIFLLNKANNSDVEQGEIAVAIVQAEDNVSFIEAAQTADEFNKAERVNPCGYVAVTVPVDVNVQLGHGYDVSLWTQPVS